MRSTVRTAEPGDAARLRALQGELTEPAPTLLDAALNQGDTASTAAATATPDTSPAGQAFTLLVAVDETDVAVGYLLALTGKRTHIAELVVDPAARREGRAKALLDTLIEQQQQPITVHVAVDNAAARSLYEAVGFQKQTRSDDRFEDAAGLTLRYPAAD